MENVIWGWLIAFYLFLGGISAGAAVINGFNGLTKLFGPKINLASAILAPFPVMVGLLLLIFDLHRPAKFYLLLLNYNLDSVMAWGVIVLTLFSLASLATLYLNWQGKEIGRSLAVTNIALGLGLAGYTGLLLSAVNHNPVWGTPVLPILFLVSAISTGVAGTLLLAGIIPSLKEKENNVKKLGKLDLGIITAEAVILLTLIIGWNLTPDGGTVLEILLFGSHALLFWLGFVLIGLVAPFVLLVFEFSGKLHLKGLNIMIATLVLFGGAVLRIVIVFAGQTTY